MRFDSRLAHRWEWHWLNVECQQRWKFCGNKTFFLMPRTSFMPTNAPNQTNHRSTVGSRSFSVAGVQVWNCLPPDVTSAPSLATFRTWLETFLFTESYPDVQLIWHFYVYTLSVVDVAYVFFFYCALLYCVYWMLLKLNPKRIWQAAICVADTVGVCGARSVRQWSSLLQFTLPEIWRVYSVDSGSCSIIFPLRSSILLAVRQRHITMI